jgi:hypothetical protein
MESDQVPANCLCCEVIIPEYEAAIRRQLRQIQELKLIIEQQSKNERRETETKKEGVPLSGK